MSVNFNDWDSVIKANNERNERLFPHYNPLTGIGSPIERFRLNMADGTYVMLPQWMLTQEPLIYQIAQDGGVSKFAQYQCVDVVDLESEITKLRLKYDFEFWAATCATIQDKKTKRKTRFILRNAQRKLLKELMDAVVLEKSIRIILLKARQWGGSTLIQLFMAWIQFFHRQSWHSVIVADIEDQARNILKMYKTLAEYHPAAVMPIRLKSFNGSGKNREVVGRECIIYLGSMQKPDSIRSADVMMAHLSEVGLWKETLGKKPEDIMQSIAGTIPSTEPFSMIVIESTAKGIGNYFHSAWLAAESGQSGYVPVFVAWYEIEIYQTPFADENLMREFVRSMNSKEQYYFNLGATLEGIHWYRDKQRTDNMSNWRMACEFPTTPQEAFQSTGNRAHAPELVEQMRRYCREPLFKGDMFADARYGKESIGKSLRFSQTPDGELWLWAEPEKGYRNRYVVSLDIGGRTDKADYSVISVIDRYWLTDGGVEECIGTWRGHLDQDLVVWKAVQVARYFDNALLAVESNSLNSKGEEGDHSLTILDEIKDDYTNLYYRIDQQKINEGLPPKYGFHTGKSSKSDLVTKFNRRLREQSYVERDKRALDEADHYEIKPDGTFGGVSGQHDDIYMSRAIGLLVSESMPIPIKLAEQKTARTTTNVVRTEANM